MYIYILTDPTGAETAYVGKTRNPVKRLKEHLNNLGQPRNPRFKWIRMLKNRGLQPMMTVFDTVPDEEASEAENDTIDMVRAIRGVHLLNVPRVGMRTGRAKYRGIKDT